jgi:hypothetical protein
MAWEPLYPSDLMTRYGTWFDMVRTFIGVLVETPKGVYLVITYVGHRRIDEAGGLGTDGRDHLGLVTLDCRSAAPDRTGGHEEGVVARAVGRRRMRAYGRGSRGDGEMCVVRGEQDGRSDGMGHWASGVR